MEPVGQQQWAEGTPPSGGAVVARCPQRVRVRRGTVVLASSSAALRVEVGGSPPALYLPAADVARGVLVDEGATVLCPVKGEVRLLSLPDARGFGSGRNLAWSLTGPPPGLARLAGMICFDHDRVVVELVDREPTDDDPSTGVKRCPAWGDARDLVALLDAARTGELSFTSSCRQGVARDVVEGSQLLGQAVVAASRCAPGRRVVSAGLSFLRPAAAARPVDLDQLSAGRSFTALAVGITQDGRLCASGDVLLDAVAADVVRHRVDPPEVPGPRESEPYDMAVIDRDVRIVDGAYSGDPDAPVSPPAGCPTTTARPSPATG